MFRFEALLKNHEYCEEALKGKIVTSTRKGGIPYTEEEINEIIKLYEEGKKVKEIALATGKNEKVVSKYIRKIKGVKFENRVTEDEIRQIKHLWSKGMHVDKIVKIVGRSKPTIWKYAREKY